MKETTKEKEKALAEHDETYNEMQAINEEYKQILDERKKREEILEMMKKKEDEQ